MNGQSRILTIFLELLEGKKLTKRSLMELYNKEGTTIRRDMAIIENVLEKNAEEKYLHEGVNYDSFEEYLKLNSLDRSEKGCYKLNGIEKRTSKVNFTDKELFVLLKVLIASRALEKDEMNVLFNKLFSMVENKKRMDYFFKNEQHYYTGVPKIDLVERLDSICEMILNRSMVEFEYTKNGETKTLRRSPNAIYFSDLYFYMLTTSQDGKDDEFLEDLNKFRINNIENLRIVKTNVKTEYKDRFEGGTLRKQTGFLCFLGKPITMVIEFNFDPVYVLDRFPESKIVSEKDGVYRIEMQVNDGYGIKMWLLSEGKMVKVISPKHMRDYIINDMTVALEYYGLAVRPKEE
ncbi:helix-turn-helix transcriptional regulator [Enterococcus faecalis]|uniref:WYL domain-containing protein n=1 Tax=Bacillus anthracis TaxID=1392 RepID=A0A640MHL4_BACAN|nr:WYL domain-containing protein [Enterococcus faecalis]GEU13541.1 WYL domain-containing protein [Bacillus anthracis]EGO7696242.1 WYL domain-containing protein [Enterococcus faecalis]EHU9655186.1 WYL domain-containing protein [Enterococcus faecalis]ELU9017126.1 WYL domain-containing protein [Enterococcus faecalis]MDQ4469147.1 WYL domain-containing protein [Enterococcus faecalis]